MKPASRHSYKSLFTDCTKRHTDKDQMIAMLQEQNKIMAEALWAADRREEQNDQLIGELQEQTAAHQMQMDLQAEIIRSQTLKVVQQNDIIELQNTALVAQQKQLEENREDLSRLANIKHELRILKRQFLGIKSERHHRPTEDADGKAIVDPQLSLELDVDAWGVCHLNGYRRINYIKALKTIAPKKCGGRHGLPEGLEEEVTIIDVQNVPPNAKCIGYEDQKQLACDPLRWYIKVTRRLIYLAPAEDALTHKQLIAPLPPHPIPKCKMDISVLVMLVTDKYLYHLPVWRQRRRFLQYGVDLPYSTLSYLVNRIADTLEPLWHLLLKEIMISRLMHVDETTYRVLDDTKKKGKKSHLGWMWAVMNPVQRICCFMYQKGRGIKDISSVLRGYKGTMLTDAHKAYIKYGQQPGVDHQKCLAHVRRYFDQALENDRARAAYALERFFAPLYAIEEEGKLLELDYDQMTEKRKAEAIPLLNALHAWAIKELPRTIPRTPIHTAIAYTLNNFKGLLIYTSDGMLQIDNNVLEREIRAITLGRNNHLFAGSHRGGERAAVIYSLMATCKLQGINPSVWLTDVLRRITTQAGDKMIELLPQFWKPQPVIQNTAVAS